MLKLVYILEFLMRMIIQFVVFFMIGFYPCLAGAGTNPPIPDFSGWVVVDMSQIELRISDCASVYIGTKTEYNNPDDQSEFIRVVSRYIELPILRCTEFDDRLLSETVMTRYAQQEEDELLRQRSENSDKFLYLHWRTKKGLPGMGDVLEGVISIWFVSADGNESYNESNNEPVTEEFLTENIGNGKLHNVHSGMKFTVGNNYHILRVSRSVIIQLIEGDK